MNNEINHRFEQKPTSIPISNPPPKPAIPMAEGADQPSSHNKKQSHV